MARFLSNTLYSVARLAGEPGLRIASKYIIGGLANAAETHRPRPWSMAVDYVSWPGQFDLTWIGRHLGRRTDGPPPPSEAQVAELFRRRRLLGSGESLTLPCPQGTTALFMAVAQWFTDSFLRTYPDPKKFGRTDSNHEIDLCQLYGLTEEKTLMLREWADGKPTHRMAVRDPDGEAWAPLLFEEDGAHGVKFSKPFNGVVEVGGEEKQLSGPLHDLKKIVKGVKRAFPELAEPGAEKKLQARLLTFHATGLDNGNGNIGYTAVNTLFLRAHNEIAGALWERKKGADGWDAERVFQTTRCILIVMLIKVVIEDYITHIANKKIYMPIGFADDARWGKPNRIAIEFNLLYRWHSMIPDEMIVGTDRLGPDEFRFNPGYVEKKGLLPMIEALSTQTAGRLALRNVPDFMLERVRTSFEDENGDPIEISPVEGSIKTARRAGLKALNDYREQFGLKRHRSFRDLVGDQPHAGELADELEALYGSVDEVELFPGLFAEAHEGRAIMGELMIAMVGYDAFTQALTNPLLSKNLYEDHDTFTAWGVSEIERVTSLKQVVEVVAPGERVVCSLGERPD